MGQLQIRLFNDMTISRGGEPPLDLGSPTIKSLLAYLILNRDRVIDRRRLSFVLWPRSTESAARRNLRQYIHRLRRVLEPVDPAGELILAEGNSLRFCPPEDWYLDVAAFEQAASCDDTLEQAVESYSGVLLADLYEDWVIPERERLARLFRQTLLRLTEHAELAGDVSRAITYAERYLEAEPLLESAHLRVMRLYYALGDRARVKELYDRLAATVAEELGAEPLPDTLAAYEAMLAGEYDVAPSIPQVEQRPRDMPPRRQKPESAEPPLIGRGHDLAWLDGNLAQAAASHGMVCLIQGESGIGKTRLVTEWLAGVQVQVYRFSGRSHEFESMLPYAPLADALRQAAHDQMLPWDLFRPAPPWLAALQSVLPDLSIHFPGLESVRQSIGGQYHIVEGLGNFFLTLARHRPVILYLDNLHWGDLPTWNFVGYLAQYAITSRVLTVITVRWDDLPHEATRLIHSLQERSWLQQRRLHRLSKEDTQTLICDLMHDDQLDPRFASRIYEETEGNPFFIIETIRAVQEAGGDWTRSVPTDLVGHRPVLAIPLRIQAVIQSRLDKLNEESRAALGVAAAIGREFSFELLKEASQLPTETLLDALDEWLVRDLVRETSNSYDFTHEKLSQVAYQQLSRARRQWIHLQIARYLQANVPDIDPAKLAHHYYLSSEPGNALPYLAQAGERALSVRSYSEAREFGLRAIGLMGRFPALNQSQRAERLDLTLQLAQAYAYTGALPRALEMLQEAERMAEALGDMARLARIFQRSARIFWLRGHAQSASDYARRTLRHAEELDDASLRLAALRMLGRVAILLSQYDDAISYLLRYIDLSEKTFPPADLPVIYGYLGVAYARVGSWQRAIDSAQKGLGVTSAELPGATHVVARMQLAFVYADLREWGEALTIAEPVRDLWQYEGMSPHLFMLRAVVGRALVHTGHFEAGLAEIEAALKWADEVGYQVLVHLPWLFMGPCLVEADPARALLAAQRAADMAARIGDRWAEAVALRTQAEIEMRLPRPEWTDIEHKLLAARAALRDIRARPDLARTYLALRRLYDRAGQMAWAVDCHFRATTIFDELGMSDELRAAQGHAAGERTGAVVIPNLKLLGPNQPGRDSLDAHG